MAKEALVPVGKALALLRVARGITRQKLADQLGVTAQYLLRVELCEIPASDLLLEDAARYLAVPTSTLIGMSPADAEALRQTYVGLSTLVKDLDDNFEGAKMELHSRKQMRSNPH